MARYKCWQQSFEMLGGVNMEPSMWTYIVLSLLVLCVARLSRKATLELPPSPPGHPIIGHALKIPKNETWKTFAEWGKLYGTIVSAKVFGRTFVIVNSVLVARDLMEGKGANFSDRPQFTLLDMTGWGSILPCLSYGSTGFRKQRRAMQQYLAPSTIRTYDRIMEERVRKLLRRLLTSPDTFHYDLHWHIASIIVKVVYGHEAIGNPEDDPLIKLSEQTVKMTTELGSIGMTFVDFLPFLRHVPSWVPGMEVKRKALQIRGMLQVVFSSPFEKVKLARAAGITSRSVVGQLLDDCGGSSEVSRLDELDMKIFAGTFYNVGADTTGSALKMFFFMMIYNHDVQKRAQKEIDEAIGLDRLPLFSDRPKLPYTDCIMKEVLRIHPPVPLGIPHRSVQVEEYRGWMIPSKVIIIPNIWYMMRDEAVIPNPEKFVPDRHVVREDGRSDTKDLVTSVFGFGRRFCPGRAFAESMLWITMANILAVFEILPCKDPNSGEDVLPNVEFVGEAINSPKPFKCRIIPRGGRLE